MGIFFGSQIFNIFLIIGVSAIITPITYEISYSFDLILLLFSSLIFAIFPFVGKKDKMTQQEGIIFLVIYIYYLMHLITM